VGRKKKVPGRAITTFKVGHAKRGENAITENGYGRIKDAEPRLIAGDAWRPEGYLLQAG
jgi:hypothetical protein